MSFLSLALQVLPLIPGLLDSGIKIADAIMDDPAVSPEDKKALADKLDELHERLNSLSARVKASQFPDFRPPA
mgnify:CR=1 FL=1